MIGRREALLLGLAALVFVAGFVARPIVRAVDPDLAVHVWVWKPSGTSWAWEHGLAFEMDGLDPWGRRPSPVILDGERRLVPQPAWAGDPRRLRARERGVGPMELVGAHHVVTSYSFGPNGLDEGTDGDDIIERLPIPRSSIGGAVVHVLAVSEVIGAWLALALVWAAACFHARTRARRLACVAALALLVAAAIYYVEERWTLALVFPTAPEHLVISPGCALFLSLSFLGTLFLAWASARREEASAAEAGPAS